MSSRSRSVSLVVVCLAALLGVWVLAHWRGTQGNPSDRPEAINSDQLTQTVIVPTLDTPIPAGKSAIWCGSFQLAWDHLRKDVVREPIKLENAQADADRLNKAEFNKSDLEPGSYYAAAGLVSDGIVEKIRTEMEEQFPDAELPDFEKASGDLVALAFAYLKAEVKFSFRYEQENAGLTFKGEDGQESTVQAFGVRQQDAKKKGDLRRQAAILFETDKDGEQFAIDLDRQSTTSQVVLAQVKRLVTLQEMLKAMEQSLPGRNQPFRGYQLRDEDTLLIPDMGVKIQHQFRELEGKDKVFSNVALQGCFLDKAVEELAFRLDRSGASVESKASVAVFKDGADHVPISRNFHFDRPFLLMMKKRGASQPFLVMWIANAELLKKLK